MRKIVVLLLMLIETWIVDTFKNRPIKAVINELPRSVLSKNKKIVYLCKPQFYFIKIGFNGGLNYMGVLAR